MVFFTCNACGESIKKVQVEKHLGVCRSCKCLSCIDCGKDFWGEEYKNHLKCISEDQKYGGKGFEAKANKGEVKQQQWIQKLHEAVKKPGLSPKLKDILNQISTYDNIPRKKAKFQNWMKNSLKIHDPATQEKVWEIFSEAHSNASKIEINTNPQAKQLQEIVKQPKESDSAPAEQNKMTLENGEKKKSKRERKEERQKNKKKEKKELNAENDAQTKKSKKRAKEMEETADAEPEETAGNDGAEKKKKNRKENKADLEVNGNGHDLEIAEPEQIKRNLKKRKHRSSEVEPEAKQKKIENIEEEYEDTTESAVKGKFNWKGTIKAVLKQAPDNEISVKKLRKKVLAQYFSVATEHHKSEEDLLVIFNKKINCNPKFKVLKEKVKLMK